MWGMIFQTATGTVVCVHLNKFSFDFKSKIKGKRNDWVLGVLSSSYGIVWSLNYSGILIIELFMPRWNTIDYTRVEDIRKKAVI
jgi:hypothetical protein